MVVAPVLRMEKKPEKKPKQEKPARPWNPADDIFGEKVVDKDLDLDGGKYSTPPPRRG
jgi:hypothetical protein